MGSVWLWRTRVEERYEGVSRRMRDRRSTSPARVLKNASYPYDMKQVEAFMYEINYQTNSYWGNRVGNYLGCTRLWAILCFVRPLIVSAQHGAAEAIIAQQTIGQLLE